MRAREARIRREPSMLATRRCRPARRCLATRQAQLVLLPIARGLEVRPLREAGHRRRRKAPGALHRRKGRRAARMRAIERARRATRAAAARHSRRPACAGRRANASADAHGRERGRPPALDVHRASRHTFGADCRDMAGGLQGHGRDGRPLNRRRRRGSFREDPRWRRAAVIMSERSMARTLGSRCRWRPTMLSLDVRIVESAPRESARPSMAAQAREFAARFEALPRLRIVSARLRAARAARPTRWRRGVVAREAQLRLRPRAGRGAAPAADDRGSRRRARSHARRGWPTAARKCASSRPTRARRRRAARRLIEARTRPDAAPTALSPRARPPSRRTAPPAVMFNAQGRPPPSGRRAHARAARVGSHRPSLQPRAARGGGARASMAQGMANAAWAHATASGRARRRVSPERRRGVVGGARARVRRDEGAAAEEGDRGPPRLVRAPRRARSWDALARPSRAELPERRRSYFGGGRPRAARRAPRPRASAPSSLSASARSAASATACSPTGVLHRMVARRLYRSGGAGGGAAGDFRRGAARRGRVREFKERKRRRGSDEKRACPPRAVGSSSTCCGRSSPCSSFGAQASTSARARRHRGRARAVTRRPRGRGRGRRGVELRARAADAGSGPSAGADAAGARSRTAGSSVTPHRDAARSTA